MRREVEFDYEMVESVANVLKMHKQFISEMCEQENIDTENFVPDVEEDGDDIDIIFAHYDEDMDTAMEFFALVVNTIHQVSSINAKRIYDTVKAEMEKFDGVDNFVGFYWDEEFYVNQ